MFKVALCLFLLTTAICIHWQSHGNFSEQNITFIRNTIDGALVKAGVSFPAKQIAKYLSDSLNSIWSTAWNVIVVGLQDNHQGSVAHYGYSYSDHWYKLSNYGKKHQTFIIWKDYHCQTWVNFNSNAPPLNDTGSLNPYVVIPIVSSTTDLLDSSEAIYQDSLFIASNMVFVAEGLFKNQQSLFESIVILGQPNSISSRFCTTEEDTDYQFKYITRSSKKTPLQKLSYLIFRSK